jgi:hypothetical protein
MVPQRTLSPTCRFPSSFLPRTNRWERGTSARVEGGGLRGRRRPQGAPLRAPRGRRWPQGAPPPPPPLPFLPAPPFTAAIRAVGGGASPRAPRLAGVELPQRRIYCLGRPGRAPRWAAASRPTGADLPRDRIPGRQHGLWSSPVAGTHAPPMAKVAAGCGASELAGRPPLPHAGSRRTSRRRPWWAALQQGGRTQQGSGRTLHSAMLREAF